MLVPTGSDPTGTGAAAIIEPESAERTAPTPNPRRVIPVPVTEICCGLSLLLSAIETVALRVPRWIGLKTTLMLQDAAGPTLEPQVSV
jgi:hypothetical protein